ncbi:MAG: metal-dependent transcriptional regulator [Anaerolineales bacterium]|nr:metal-dependent transcriptional regulator [Anaerolineales bacterium]
MHNQLSASAQDYMKTIYRLTLEQEYASTNQVAQQIGVAPASATGMIQRLAASQPPLVIYQKHRGTRLTRDGERTALEIIRHHRLLETYLVNALGYSWDTVHEEACRLEHVISEEFEMRIAAFLGNPQRDPHGELIPSAELVMPADLSCPLSELRPNEKATITQVHANDPALLRYLESIGITPGVQVEALGYSPFDQTLEIKISGHKPKTLGFGITSQISVEMQSPVRSNNI